jgi:hypothetical protein
MHNPLSYDPPHQLACVDNIHPRRYCRSLPMPMMLNIDFVLAHPRLPIRYLEPLATTRWENAAGIHDYARKLQGGGTDVNRLPKRR